MLRARHTILPFPPVCPYPAHFPVPPYPTPLAGVHWMNFSCLLSSIPTTLPHAINESKAKKKKKKKKKRKNKKKKANSITSSVLGRECDPRRKLLRSISAPHCVFVDVTPALYVTMCMSMGLHHCTSACVCRWDSVLYPVHVAGTQHCTSPCACRYDLALYVTLCMLMGFQNCTSPCVYVDGIPELYVTVYVEGLQHCTSPSGV